MPHKFNVLIPELMTALLFASQDEARIILNGVHIECKPGAMPILVATDGRRLAVIETEAMQPDDTEPFEGSCILSSEILKPLCAFAKKITPKIGGGLITLELHPPQRIIFSFSFTRSFLDVEDGALLEGTYPNWRQCLPCGDKQPVPQVCVNSEFVADFYKVAKTLDCDPMVRFNLFTAESAIEARLTAKPNFYAVIMPAKGEEIGEFQPEFVGMPAPTPKENAA